MKSPVANPRRWRDRGADTRALEDRAALLVDAAGPVPALGPEALSRIRTEVLARRSPGVAHDPRRRTVRARLALAAGLLLLSMATARGASVLWRRYVAPAPPAAGQPPSAGKRSTAPPARTPHRQSLAATAVKVRESPPEEARSPSTNGPGPIVIRRSPRAGAPPAPGAVVANPAPPPPIAHAPPNTPPDLPPPVTMAPVANPAPDRAARVLPANAADQGAPPNETEARLVAHALSQLRQRKDPRGALVTLDQYARLFPHGVLESEAQRTRIEAALQLNDRKTALALLDGRQTSPDALGADLLLARAELRASAGRCPEATGDFSRILDGPTITLGTRGSSNDANERALYGRAICLGQMGQDSHARADLVAYRRRFPAGRFAAEVARLLDASRLPPGP